MQQQIITQTGRNTHLNTVRNERRSLCRLRSIYPIHIIHIRCIIRKRRRTETILLLWSGNRWLLRKAVATGINQTASGRKQPQRKVGWNRETFSSVVCQRVARRRAERGDGMMEVVQKGKNRLRSGKEAACTHRMLRCAREGGRRLCKRQPIRLKCTANNCSFNPFD